MKKILLLAFAMLAFCGTANAAVVSSAAQPRNADGVQRDPDYFINIDKDFVGTVNVRPYDYLGRPRDPRFAVLLDTSGNQISFPNLVGANTWDFQQTFTLSPFITPLAGGGVQCIQANNGGKIIAANCATIAPVSSVFGRTGAVVAATNDYSIGQINGAGTAASANTGTSGGTLCLLNAACGWSGVNTFTTASTTLPEVIAQSPTGGIPLQFQNTSNSKRWDVVFNSATDLAINEHSVATSLILKAGGGVVVGNGTFQTIAGTTAAAPLNIPQGAAPTSPNNGDVWTTSGGPFARINGTTQGIASISSTTWTPTITFATPGNLAVTYSTQTGAATRIVGADGTAMCFIRWDVTTSAFTFTTASGVFRVLGEPYTVPSGLVNEGVVSSWSGFTGLTASMIPALNTAGQIFLNTGTTSATNVTTSGFTTGTNISMTGSISFGC